MNAPALRSLAALALLASPLAGCGPRGLAGQMARAEKQGNKVEEALDLCEAALRSEKFDEAEKSLRRAKDLLAGPDMDLYPDRSLLQNRVEEDGLGITAGRTELIRRERQRAIAQKRVAVQKAMAALDQALEAVRLPDYTGKDVKLLKAAVAEAQSALDAGKELEADAAYGPYARESRQKVGDADKEYQSAGKLIDFLEGPALARREGLAALEKGSKEKGAEARVKLLEEASAKLGVCAQKGRTFLAENPDAKAAPVALEDGVSTPQSMVQGCEAKLKAVAKLLEPARKAAAREVAKQAALAAKAAKKKK